MAASCSTMPLVKLQSSSKKYRNYGSGGTVLRSRAKAVRRKQMEEDRDTNLAQFQQRRRKLGKDCMSLMRSGDADFYFVEQISAEGMTDEGGDWEMLDNDELGQNDDPDASHAGNDCHELLGNDIRNSMYVYFHFY